MAKIIISKLERYPSDEPNSFAVGFSVECVKGRTFYVDTVVPFTQATTDEEAVKVAYEQLKESIDNQVATLEAKSSLLGKELVL